ncbi:MAG: HAMP domain-containing sensor histidine kinase [Candidatus Peribacteraceae bacterium]|nr:HAMP domain-containing sensor histidine kinase [Candidatus Peribacteraceae bacterium]
MEKKASQFRAYKIYVPLIVGLVIVATTTYILYTKTEQLFRWSVDQRMLALASVASTQFNPDELDKITKHDSYKTDAYQKIVQELMNIRNHADKLKFAYILRKTNDPNNMEFVTDADSLHPDVPEDINGDGIIDESDQKTYPGDPYDVSSFPEFKRDAFVKPFVDPTVSHDQWGSYLTGTAPITNLDKPNEPIRYVIGMDLDVSDFLKLERLALIPFVVALGVLFLVITALMFVIKRMWKNQVVQLAEIDRQKDELISIVSHQLASPISSVQWSLQDMVDGDFGQLTDEQKTHLQEDMKTTRNLLDLAGLLLDVSRIELGRLKMSKQKQSLSEFFKEIITVIEQKAKEKGVNFSHALSESLPDGTFDKRLTHMTIENLLTNAVKYTPTGGSVNLSVTMLGGTLSCVVKDTGVGIPKKDQPQLFGKLFRASNVQDVDGNGFGLYVAKGAIEQQGGKIRFESEEGKGTTFFVELPV